MNNNTEWQTIHYYQACLEVAERCGFKIEQNIDNQVRIISTKSPYNKGVILKYANGFSEALCWLQGYEQRIFEVKNT